jgi:HemY protein
MRRVFLLFALVAAGAALAIWFADRPGMVSLQWAGFRFDTSVGILFALVAVIAIGAAALYRFWRFLLRAPRNLASARRARRSRRGYRFLTQGMVAVAAGDSREAGRLSKKADRLLQEPPLTMLLSAQAAQLDGDETAARRYFEAMLDEPDMAFLGVRGLLTQAIKTGDSTQALALAERAAALRPKTEWVIEELFAQQIAAADWDAADDTMHQAGRGKVIDPEIVRRRRAVLAVAQCAALDAGGDAGGDSGKTSSDALKSAERACKLDPGLTPATAALARLLAAGGKNAKAARLIENAWRRDPHPELAAVYNTIGAKGGSSGPTLDQVKRIQRLADSNPDHAESHIALARASLSADLWGEARRHLDAVINQADEEAEVGARVYRLMADIEMAERGDSAAAGRWFGKASRPDESWICESCGAAHGAWRAACGHCGGFDALRWRTPRNLTLPESEASGLLDAPDALSDAQVILAST